MESHPGHRAGGGSGGERAWEAQFPHLSRSPGRPAPPDAPPRPGPAPRPAGHPEWSPTPAAANPRRPASGALGLARGPPAPGAGSLLVHSAALAAATAVAAAAPDSVRPGRGRAPRAGLAGAALRAAADSRAGSARGRPGPGPGRRVGRRSKGAQGEPPAPPSDSRLSREPETRAGRGLPSPRSGSSLGASPGSVCTRRPEGCSTLRTWPDASSPWSVGPQAPFPAPSRSHPPGVVLGLGVRPRGRSTSRRIQVQAMEGCFVLRTWQDASGLGPLGPPAFFPNIQARSPERIRSGGTTVL